MPRDSLARFRLHLVTNPTPGHTSFHQQPTGSTAHIVEEQSRRLARTRPVRWAQAEQVAPLDVEAVVSNMGMEIDVVVEEHFFGVSAAE